MTHKKNIKTVDKKQQQTPRRLAAVIPAILLMAAILSAAAWLRPSARLEAQDERWTVVTHDKTNFPLLGRHRDVSCSECHLNGVMQGTPRECEACHWQRKQDDRYKLQLGTHCDDCHTPFDWKILKPNAWEHLQVTGYALDGIHKTLDCFQCHKNNTFSARPGDCYDCHAEDYRGADDPNHIAGNFPTDCKVCHPGMVTWEGAIFNHTVYPLSGAHQTADCTACHTNGQYTGTPNQCSGCHMEDYNNTADPNHLQAGYSTDCENCHGSQAVTWDGAQADHSNFPLRGAHQTADCTACHTGGQYTGTPNQCSGCHMEDYNNTTDPNHQQAGYSTDCESCHGGEAVTWDGAQADHSNFPLRGAHQTADCTACHAGGQYTGTPNQCSGCHMEDYNNTANPNHQQAGYSTDCENCHGSEAVTWAGAVVDHSNFPLRGAHQTADCTACHTTGQYTGLSQVCYSCHQDDYDGVTEPNHQQAGFSTECVPCHGSEAVTWSGAVFDHNLFFQLQGAHVNLACNTCHAQGYDLPTDCYGCHRQDYENAADPNHQTAGFPTDCETCHFSTHVTWEQAVFSHDFPIDSGDHSGFDCTDCHLTTNYQVFSCIDCHEHNKAEMDEEHKDENGYSYNSQACYSCHPRGKAD